jgi:DNA-binding transcriptional LysR family regulator
MAFLCLADRDGLTLGRSGLAGNGTPCNWVLQIAQRPASPQRRLGYHRRMRELQFDDMHLFSRVAELGTLSAVARERDVPVSQISRSLARIEKACGARLVHRSTHALSLTAEGETFRDYCRRLIGTLDELEGEFAGKSGEVSGVVRVAASTVVAQHQLVPSLPALAEKYPRLIVDLDVGDRTLDLAREGIDIAIRTMGQLPDTMIARQIGTLGRGLYASPTYVKEAGLPATPDELRGHRLITNTNVAMLNQWPFIVKGRPQVFQAEGHWRTNDTNMGATMVLQGLGIGRLATLVGDPLVKRKLLVPVLQKFVDTGPVAVYAITAPGRHRLPKIKACIDYWAEWFAKTSSRPGAKP